LAAFLPDERRADHDCRGRGCGILRGDCLRQENPGAQVTLCELTAQPLAKVRISGGGRCNVTTAFTDPADLVRYYPRGGRELRGAFHRWGPAETVAWFAAHGVELKAQADGRMFPVTDDAGTVVACLQRTAAEAGVTLRTRCGVRAVRPGFELELTTGETVVCDRLLIATGGGKAGGGLELARQLGHTIVPPVPSLVHVSGDGSPVDRIGGICGGPCRGQGSGHETPGARAIADHALGIERSGCPQAFCVGRAVAA
jgi:predicted Rossmann fold flavoprotein